MQYQFNQAVMLKGVRYSRGVFEVPEEVEKHPDFLHFVKAGFIVEPEVVKAPLESMQARSKRLFDKLSKKAPAPAPVPPVDPNHPIEVHKELEKAQFKKAEKPKVEETEAEEQTEQEEHSEHHAKKKHKR